MRRDYFDADVRNVADEQAIPVVAISFDGPSGALAERLVSDDGPLDDSEIDVTYRLTTGKDEDEANGVLSVANRITGEFILEANLKTDAVFSLVSSVKRMDGDETHYRLRLTDSERESTVYDTETLLVYDADGGLLRERSLIPGGVEL